MKNVLNLLNNLDWIRLLIIEDYKIPTVPNTPYNSNILSKGLGKTLL